ncbi:hypothetical protein [Paracidovorax avenae]|uniref:hypothetical protein n=1 Tax=Paracidovorax avenae TaxID=80867 RepID=UPI000D1639B8|nr:hypothetical protein [Paracidovorax avenae]AVS83622.1 hypothetical protein C8239_01685 [Paracidovorax avenae]AVS87050.1 hypothetical protein C8238_01230 [Paracidovorax avenae]AVS94880.1 hypothetical protein C8232_00310 [Paracidovorax avenae]AVT01222.1 hypothetical protein C8243_01060 [Paracidovorax avenae]AVT08297.1 hypothetical protein C8242_01425 [Paracidovorax avenae]
MLRRIVIVFMLLLLPLQWAAAQMHESEAPVESAEVSAAAPAHPAAAAAPLQDSHAQEPGGAPCLFHTLAQPSAPAELPDARVPAASARSAWAVPSELDHHGTGADEDIDRPRWPARSPLTVDRRAHA